MIDAEEVFESAAETGYRLCSAGHEVVEDGKIEARIADRLFSAHWDANNAQRVFACTQDGMLKVMDLRTNLERRYSMLFRPYSTAELAAGGREDAVNLLDDDVPLEKASSSKIANSKSLLHSRKVSYHWDKMVTIPDRPDEIIFLLGVTKSLYYTALPGSTGPYPEEPYLARTTRYDFSDYIYGTPVMELWTHDSRITSLSVSPFGQIVASGDENGNLRLLVLRLLDELSISLKAEQKKKKKSGPAPINAFRPEHKIAQVAHSGPVFSMQWLPTVCEGNDYTGMRAYCLATGSTDRTVKLWRVTCSTRQGLAMQPLMSLDTLTTHILCLGSFVETSIVSDTDIRVLSLSTKDFEGTNSLLKTVEMRRQQLAQASAAQSVTAAMGMGTDIRSTISLDNPFATDEAVTPFRVLGGGRPKSLASTGLSLLSEHVFLAAGTNLGAVYVWKIRWKFIVDILAQCYDKSIKQSTVLDDGSHLHSLIQSSDRPVINVALSSAVDSAILNDFKASSLREILKHRSGRNTRILLAASDTNGTVRTHCEVDAVDAAGKRVTTPGIKGPITICGEARYASAVVSCAFIENDIEAEAEAADRQIENGEYVDPNCIVQSTSKLFVCLSDGTMQLVRSGSLTQLSMLRSDKPKPNTNPLDSVVVPVYAPRSNSLVAEVSYVPQLDDEEEDDEDDAYGDALSNPDPAVTETKTYVSSSGKPVITFPIPADQQADSVAGARPSRRTGVPEVVEEEEESISGPTPRPLPRRLAPSDKPSGVAMQPGKAAAQLNRNADESKRLNGKKVVIDEKGNTVSTDIKKANDENDEVRVLSDYAYPTINSSQRVHASLMQAQRQIENADEISISTIHTTSTDRYVAANVAATARFGPSGSQYNYRGIVPVDFDPRPAQKRRLQKQVDPKWAARKQLMSPTADDLRLLCPPDPYVKINLKTTPAGAGSFPLKASIDPDELVPRFALDVNLDDVFGKMDEEAARRGAESCLDKIDVLRGSTTII